MIISTDKLSEQLYDQKLYDFWRDHSVMYHPSAAERMMDVDDSNLCIVNSFSVLATPSHVLCYYNTLLLMLLVLYTYCRGEWLIRLGSKVIFNCSTSTIYSQS